uniref:ABC-type glutathione-S-conjugate transporter n=1 Tax=Glossina palpalis gambiensis TaxID=67801 RepID=A0A1B0BL95_9MUSC
MDEFCGSTFWDANETWYTNNPDFTPCFEQTVLVWAPCSFLWLFSIFDFYYLKASLDKNIPWNKLNISKLLLTLSLLLLTAVDFFSALVKEGNNETADLIYPVDVWTPVVKFATFLLIFIFIPLNRKYGVQTSGCQFLFWLLLVIFSIPRCRTEVRAKRDRDNVLQSATVDKPDYSWDEYKYISFMVYFAFSCAMLFLNCFADAMPRDTKYDRSENEIPENSASFLSRVTYQWFDGMALKGYRKPLEEKDLWDLRAQDSCKEIMPIFAYYWNKNVRKYYKLGAVQPKAQYKDGTVIFDNPHVKMGNKKGMASIMPPIIRSFGGVFLFGSMMKLFCDILTFVQPQILRLIIAFVEDNANGETESQPEWKGILYSALLFLVAAAQTFILGQYFQRMFIVGLRIRTALINAIYRKALVISNTARKESTVGEIVNLMAVDAQRFMDLTTYLNMLWSAPLQIALALYFLWELLGPSVLAGLAVMIILIPLNGVIANRIKTYQIRQMKYKDDRVKLMNEVLSGIKVLKLYAWEPSFEKKVLEIRDKEIATLKSTAYLNASTSFLWSCAPFLASLDKNIPWNKLNISKLLLTLSLLLLTAVDFFSALVKEGNNETADLIYPVDVWTPVVKFATFLLIFIFIPLNRKYGVQTSGCQFLFWLLLVIFSIPRCRTEVRAKRDRDNVLQSATVDKPDYSWDEYKYISFMVYFAFSCAMLFLNCFADAMPRDTKYDRSENEIPENSASFLSRVTYQWFDGMALKGYRKPLEEKDLWDLRAQDSCKEIMPIFAYYWNKNVRKYYKLGAVQPKAQYKDGTVIFDNPHVKMGNKKGMASIMPPIIRSFGGVFLFGSMMKLFCDILTFVQPQILRLIIAFVEDNANGETESQPEWKGILYSALLFLVAAAQTFILGQYFQRMFIVGLRIRTALINAIYRKALVISNTARKESTVGEIVNLMAVDAQRFMDLTTYLNMLWSAPLQIALALYFLWELLGPSVLAGLAVMIILIPLNGVIANRIKTYQIRQMKYKDDRVKLMNEVLSGIKVLKLYAWEPSFEKKVLEIRDKEIATLKSTAYLNASTSFLWSCAPFLVSLATFTTYVLVSDENHLTATKIFVGLSLFDIINLPLIAIPMLMVDIVEVSLVTFATYVLIDENNVLDATKTFVSLSLFNILRFPLTMLPMLISNMVQTQVSVNRINKFMNSEELDPNNVQHDSTKPHPLIIENGSFSWGDDESTLKNINIEVKKNTLCAIVGTVGSGKSSILQSFLGEMDKISGTVNTVGSIAYVPQQAWIQNATFRENILFGKPYDRRRYNRVINACALKPDIEILSAGDLTEIGEKGINLSGGQKQRISLARAVYNNADIYLLDDPLSAVDSHVGKHIFEEVIGPGGILANKTRILVTHGITFLPQTDNIYVMKLGEISENGTYQDLLNKRGDFSDFLLQHIQEGNEEVENLDEIKLHLEGNLQSEELKDRFQKAITLARTESLSDAVSVHSLESTSTVRRRKLERESSEISINSINSRTKLNIEEQGKLIETEKSQTGGVEFAVYKHYIKSVGVFLSMATLLLNFIFQAFQIGSNLWLTRWSNDKRVEHDTSLRDMYLGVYGAFGFGQVISQCFYMLTLTVGCLRCSRTLHRNLLYHVLRWPMETYDITPKGRIITRLTKDINTVDLVLPFDWRICINHSFLVNTIIHHHFIVV